MSQSNDLDIYSYNYFELLELFKIQNNFDNSNKIIMIEKIKVIQENLSPEYYYFYLKAYKIINYIYFLHDNGIILNIDNKKIEEYVDKIKKIKSFEKMDMLDILNKLKINIPNNDEIIELNSVENIGKQIIQNDIGPPQIQEQKYTNKVGSTFSNAVAPGYLNSIKRVTHFFNLNLNTCFRSNYYNSNPCNFQYIIPAEIKNVVSLRLASIEIPNSWYLFSTIKTNNIFEIEINNNGTITNYEIIIPDGNYDNNTLPDYLNNTYFYNSGQSNDLTYIEYSIDAYSSKSKFNLTGIYPSNFCFTIKFNKETNNNIMNTFGWIIGFRLATYKSITNYIESEGIFDGGGDRYIYVSIDDYQYNNNTLNMVCFDNSIMEKNIIAKIPMVNGKLSLIVDDNTSPLTKTRKYNGPVNIRNLFIKILDQYGEIIDLNNMDYSLTLELELLYEGFNFKHINS
jgi:hypothetical protein